MNQDEQRPGPGVAAVFDGLADTYDQTGVEFFRPVAARLVTLLNPRPGERALDIGSGRGAATVPLARAVGPDGFVDAIDVAPAMVAGTRAVVEDEGLRNVRAEVGDAADLAGIDRSAYDVIASSLVLFFLAEPLKVLTGWVDRLVPNGRIGLTTFGPLDGPSSALDDLLVPHQPPELRDARTSGTTGPFASDAGMEELLRSAGARDVTTVVEPAVIEFEDVDAWHRFSMSTGQRAMWKNIPPSEHPQILEQAAEILDRTRTDGPGRLVWQMRYSVGRR